MPLKKLGEWEVIAPREDVEGVEITVVGFIDVDQDGPSDGDPAGFDRQVVKLTEEEAAKDSPTFEGFKVTVSDDPNYTSFPGGSFGSVTPDESAGAPVLVETSNEEDGPEDEDLAEEEENAEGEDVDLPGEETDNAEPAGDAPIEEAAADEAPADEAPADGAVGAEEAAGPVAPDENDGEPVGDTTAPAEAPSN